MIVVETIKSPNGLMVVKKWRVVTKKIAQYTVETPVSFLINPDSIPEEFFVDHTKFCVTDDGRVLKMP